MGAKPEIQSETLNNYYIPHKAVTEIKLYLLYTPINTED